jgi:ABC-2 type transport system permease protein
MTTLPLTVNDSATMLRRNLLHVVRYPSNALGNILMPVVMLLLFGYIFGDAMGAGLGATDGSSSYLNYLVPGIVIMTVAVGSISTAVSVNTDMTEGIIARFRTMAIARTSILTGHVVGSMIQTLTSIALVIGVAALMGFRPTAGVGAWLAAIGLLIGLTFALTWLSVAFGLVSKSPEAASNLPMPIMFLPFIGSALIPPDSMPAGVRWFAEFQPFTPIIETLRGLLMDTPITNTNAVLAVSWCLAITLAGYLWSGALFRRDPGR